MLSICILTISTVKQSAIAITWTWHSAIIATTWCTATHSQTYTRLAQYKAALLTKPLTNEVNAIMQTTKVNIVGFILDEIFNIDYLSSQFAMFYIILFVGVVCFCEIQEKYTSSQNTHFHVAH